MTEGQWEFPEDVMVNRAIVEALINLLTSNGTIDVNELRKQFLERLEGYRKKEIEPHQEKVATG